MDSPMRSMMSPVSPLAAMAEVPAKSALVAPWQTAVARSKTAVNLVRIRR